MIILQKLIERISNTMDHLQSYCLTLMIKMIPYKERTHGHPHLLIRPLDTLVPPVPVCKNTEQNSSELCPWNLILRWQEGHQIHHHPPDHVIVNDLLVHGLDYFAKLL